MKKDKIIFPLLEDFKTGLGSWQPILKGYIETPEFVKTYEFVKSKYESEEKCYPPIDKIFNAFQLTAINNLKVVVVGQDPYHQPGQAMGLSFSVQRGISIPPSLLNIYKAIKQDPKIENFEIPKHGDLTKWAEQGILLLNDTLTVTKSSPMSHSKAGWNNFTDFVIQTINKEKEGIIFVLWGKPAQKKKKLINGSKHHVLESVHPSPLSASKGFFTCGHFSMINELLRKRDIKDIDWQL